MIFHYSFKTQNEQRKLGRKYSYKKTRKRKNKIEDIINF